MKKIILISSILITALSHQIQAQSGSSHLNTILTTYLNLKDALAADKSDSARQAAKTLYNSINKLEMDKLSADQHEIWMQYESKLSYDAEHIKETDELDHQREHFTNLSVNMYKIVKALKINTTTIYYQFCPMANGGKGGYWLSENSEIHNPYMGRKMPTCGSTKETIKANQ
jgi:hypothetical protein